LRWAAAVPAACWLDSVTKGALCVRCRHCLRCCSSGSDHAGAAASEDAAEESRDSRYVLMRDRSDIQGQRRAGDD
jgi:hypothetical protein